MQNSTASSGGIGQAARLLATLSDASETQMRNLLGNEDLVLMLLDGNLSTVDREAFAALLNHNPLDRYAEHIPQSIDGWIARLRVYNEKYWDNYFTDEAFAAAEDQLAYVPADHVQSVDNVFGFHVQFGSIAETFEMWYKVYEGELPNAWRWDGLVFDEEHFQLHELARSYDHGIHLVNLNLVAHWEPEKGRSIETVRQQAKEAGEILAQLEPVSFYGVLLDLFQMQDGDNLPYIDLAGTMVTVVAGDEVPRRAMYFGWHAVSRGAGFSADDVGSVIRSWASPVVREYKS